MITNTCIRKSLLAVLAVIFVGQVLPARGMNYQQQPYFVYPSIQQNQNPTNIDLEAEAIVKKAESKLEKAKKKAGKIRAFNEAKKKAESVSTKLKLEEEKVKITASQIKKFFGDIVSPFFGAAVGAAAGTLSQIPVTLVKFFCKNGTINNFWVKAGTYTASAITGAYAHCALNKAARKLMINAELPKNEKTYYWLNISSLLGAVKVTQSPLKRVVTGYKSMINFFKETKTKATN